MYIVYFICFISIIIIISLSYSENFIGESGYYPIHGKYIDHKYIDNKKKIKLCNKPRFTPFNGGNPMMNEMRVGDYYDNIPLPTMSATDYKVSPECCKYSRFSTSSGCICTDN